MSRRELRGVLQLAFLLLVAFALVRLFPLALRAGEAAATSIVQFWIVALAIFLGGWLIWVLRKRNN